ncbi:conserved hypothetical protein [Arthrobacter sp. Hiyo6]|nr:conserved hypothetical protein [Arthrobacter sp. Hiyo6]
MDARFFVAALLGAAGAWVGVIFLRRTLKRHAAQAEYDESAYEVPAEEAEYVEAHHEKPDYDDETAHESPNYDAEYIEAASKRMEEELRRDKGSRSPEVPAPEAPNSRPFPEMPLPPGRPSPTSKPPPGSYLPPPMSPSWSAHIRRMMPLRGFRRLLWGQRSLPSASETDEQEPQKSPDARFPNVYLYNENLRSIEPLESFSPGAVIRLMIGIGMLDKASRVLNPRSFAGLIPEREVVVIRVLVASTSFTIGSDRSSDGSTSSEQELTLPADGGPGATADGNDRLLFSLRCPEWPGKADARINYYYRDALIGSQILRADIGWGPGQNSVETGYLVSSTLLDVDEIPDVSRVSLLLDAGPSGMYTAVLRPADSSVASEAVAFSIPETAVGDLVRDVRAELARTVTSRRVHSKKELIEDLRRLAPPGAKLHNKLFVQASSILGPLLVPGQRPILSIARPLNVTFTLPWNLIYQISLPSGRIEDVPVCPLVMDWDERGPLIEGVPNDCPRAVDVEHTNLLCPFGFWGFGITVESPASSLDPKVNVSVRKGATVLVAETSALTRETLSALATHTDGMAQKLDLAFPGLGIQLIPQSTKAEVQRIITQDLPLVYFFCHGDRPFPSSPDISLSVGKNELISADEFIGWAKDSYRTKPFWSEVRPLVFINACEALDISPKTLLSYVDAFVGGAHAMGVVGTDVPVPATLAMQYADIFFNELLVDNATLEEATKKARFAFLADGNLFGLAYNSCSWSHLKLVASTSG